MPKLILGYQEIFNNMDCPNCGNRNPEGNSQCEECGTLFGPVCPVCGNTNRPQAHFCDNCGYRLANSELVFEPYSSPTTQIPQNISQYIPETFAARLEAARNERLMVGERRVVTILFCDVVGSTEAAGKLDPEEWGNIINRAFEYMIRPIYKYEGTVARLMGDGILAFFGAPITHEDDSHRAILAGLDIVNGINGYRDMVKSQWGFDFDVRVGINTGMVVVGNVGSDLQMEYTALGDTINIAARMEQTAQPGSIQITADTQRLVSSWFEFEDLGEIPLKGKDRPIRVYRVLHGKIQPESILSLTEDLSPLIGRERELSLLKSAVNNLHDTDGGIIALIGEAGLGKSRLIRELKNWVFEEMQFPPDVQNHNTKVNHKLRWYESLSLSYETKRPYTLFIHLLRHIWKISPHETGEPLRSKINEALSKYPSHIIQKRKPILETFFGLELDENQSIPDAEVYKHQLYQVILDLFQEWSEKKPLVMVFDDLQWADPASLALLQHISQLTLQKPILILFAMRDDRLAQSWQLKSDLEDQFPDNFSELYLAPLTGEQGKEMVENLLCTTGTPNELCDYVLEKAEGNPFYLEEIVRSLIDSGVIAKIDPENPRSEYNWQDGFSIDDINIPDNVYALLAARIDRLSNASRRLLQLASVIGRTFPYQLLQQIYDSPEMLDENLSELHKAEMIQEIALEPEKEFVFRHALTQETAYRSILRSRRREYHLKVGEVLEFTNRDQIENVSSTLAYHFEKANDERRSVDYNLIAGETALHLYALPQALDHFTRAAEVIRIQEYPTEIYTPEIISKVYKRRGRAFELSSNFKQALDNYIELEGIARKCELERVLLTALISQTLLYCTPTVLFNGELGEKLLTESINLAQKLKDKRAEAKILWLELNLSRFIRDQARARKAGEKSLQIVRELDIKEQLPYTLHDLAYAYSALDMVSKSIETFREAGSVWRELNNLPMLADSISGNVLNYYAKGEGQDAIAASEEAYRISSEINNLWGQSFSRMEVGLVYRDQGQPTLALEMMHSSIQLGEQAGFSVPSIFVPSQISFVYGDLGLYDKGLEYAEKAINIYGAPLAEAKLLGIFATIYNLLLKGEISRAESVVDTHQLNQQNLESFVYIPYGVPIYIRILQTQGRMKQAMEMGDTLVASLRREGMNGFLPESLYTQSLLLLHQGKVDQAKDNLHEALQISEMTGNRRMRWQILNRLSELSSGKEASKLRAQARQDLIYIIEHIHDGDMRSSFLSLPTVRALIGELHLI